MTWTRGRPPSWGPASTRRRLQKSWTATERSVPWALLCLCGVLALKGLVKLQNVVTFVRNCFNADWAIWNRHLVSGLKKSRNPRSVLHRRYPTLVGKETFRKLKDTRQIFSTRKWFFQCRFCRCKASSSWSFFGDLGSLSTTTKTSNLLFQKERLERSCFKRTLFIFLPKMMDHRLFRFFLPFLVQISFSLSLLFFLSTSFWFPTSSYQGHGKPLINLVFWDLLNHDYHHLLEIA